LSWKRIEDVSVTSGAGGRGGRHVGGMHATISPVAAGGLSDEVGVLLDLRWRRIELSELLDWDGKGLGLQ